ncbi:MAG: hypothetical protein ACPG51_04305 [Thiolinea sp.]
MTGRRITLCYGKMRVKRECKGTQAFFYGDSFTLLGCLLENYYHAVQREIFIEQIKYYFTGG